MTGYAREHRDSLLVILSRVQRGVQSSAEAALLRTHVEHLLTEIDQHEAAVARVRATCDRIETAVRDNPTSPDLDGGYLACLGHIRAALDEPKEP